MLLLKQRSVTIFFGFLEIDFSAHSSLFLIVRFEKEEKACTFLRRKKIADTQLTGFFLSVFKSGHIFQMGKTVGKCLFTPKCRSPWCACEREREAWFWKRRWRRIKRKRKRRRGKRRRRRRRRRMERRTRRTELNRKRRNKPGDMENNKEGKTNECETLI